MKNLFLEGPSGYGKSTVILNTLGRDRLINAGGFMTVRLHNEDDSMAGFAVVEAKDAVGPNVLLNDELYQNSFIRFEGGRRQRRQSILTEFIKRSLSANDDKLFILMDEIGGLEITDAEHRELIIETLRSSKPVIGVFKSRENACRMSDNLSLGDEYMEEYDEFRREVECDTDSTIIDVRGMSADEVARIVNEWTGALDMA